MTPDCRIASVDSPEPRSSLLITLDVHSSTLGVHGELDCSSAPLLLESVSCLLAHSDSRNPLTLSLRGVTFLDSYGVDAVAATVRAAADTGRQCVLLPPPEQIARVFTLAGAAELLLQATQREDARFKVFTRGSSRPIPAAVRAEMAMRRAERVST